MKRRRLALSTDHSMSQPPMVQSASGAGGPPEAIITGISTRMVCRPSVSGRNRDGRAQTPARVCCRYTGDAAYGGRGDLEPLMRLAVQLRALDAEVRGARRPTGRSGRPTRQREANQT